MSLGTLFKIVTPAEVGDMDACDDALRNFRSARPCRRSAWEAASSRGSWSTRLRCYFPSYHARLQNRTIICRSAAGPFDP